MAVEPFGEAAEGVPVERVTLSAHGLTVRLLTWGATVQDLWLDEVDHPLVLGFKDLEGYLASPGYFGAIVGRFANRIAHGRACIGGRDVALERNWKGHTLHGGAGGSGRQVWQIAEATKNSVTLHLSLPDGHMGFPATLEVDATYRIAAEGSWRLLEDSALAVPHPGAVANLDSLAQTAAALDLTITAKSDAETICSFAPHSYFNLEGAIDIAGHRLAVEAARYLPVDEDLIPTGEIAPVNGTRFDLGGSGQILGPDRVFDHNLCLSEGRQPLRPVALLSGGGVGMVLSTTEPGLQIYTADGLSASRGLGGRAYGSRAGIALEPQAWPDAPNRPWAAQAILRPGETRVQRSVFAFARIEGEDQL
ncbi:MAG: aldose epimerase family protein [Pseudomonadota bacterium]